jgi:hypothetical protein
MQQLQIALEDGFHDDLVVVDVDGWEERFEDVTTSQLLGLADSRDIEVPDGAAAVKITVPSKNLSATIPLPSPIPGHLSVSVDQEGIHYRFRDQPVGYA